MGLMPYICNPFEEMKIADQKQSFRSAFFISDRECFLT